MLKNGGKTYCEYCFTQISREPCKSCGYGKGSTPADKSVLPPGTVLAGKYIVGMALGKGGFGVTYLAFDMKREQRVAVKEYYPYGMACRMEDSHTISTTRDEDAPTFQAGLEKFYDEAKLVSRFNGNPNIVSVYEFFYENNTAYFVMEYLTGMELKKYVKLLGRNLTAGEAVFIAGAVTDALMIAHSRGVLHRDVSPDNILLCESGDVKLIDFGAARQVVAEQSKSLSVILKQGFAPMEQYQRRGKQGPWTDIYALGATIFYAVTGKLLDDPMTRCDQDEMFSENLYGVDPGLFQVLKKCTMLRIEDRYQNTFQLKEALNGLDVAPEAFTIPSLLRQPEQGAAAASLAPTAATQGTVGSGGITAPAGENAPDDAGTPPKEEASDPMAQEAVADAEDRTGRKLKSKGWLIAAAALVLALGGVGLGLGINGRRVISPAQMATAAPGVQQ